MVETETYTIEAPNGATDTVDLPEGLVDVLSEQGEEPASVVAEVTLLAFVQRAHSIVHHSEGEVPDDLLEINEKAEELFEERFGVSFAEATGHHH
jgi:tRNA(Ser,Leu) C12 N-acetylase TAN1